MLRAELTAGEPADPVIAAQTTVEGQHRVEQWPLQFQLDTVLRGGAPAVQLQRSQVGFAGADAFRTQGQAATLAFGQLALDAQPPRRLS